MFRTVVWGIVVVFAVLCAGIFVSSMLAMDRGPAVMPVIESSVRAVPLPAPRATVAKEPVPAPIPREERAADRRDAREQAPAGQCVVSMPGSDGDVPVLPTEKGYDEFASAIAQTGDGNARNVVFLANSGFWVEKGTRCVVVDLGLTASQVRLVDGKHVGKAGWLPNEWRRGE